MADKDLTVEEILLRCRQLDGEGGSAPEAEAPVEVPAEEVVAEPASAPAPIDPSGMSVADMLAAARASASGEEDGGSTAFTSALDRRYKIRNDYFVIYRGVASITRAES